MSAKINIKILCIFNVFNDEMHQGCNVKENILNLNVKIFHLNYFEKINAKY